MSARHKRRLRLDIAKSIVDNDIKRMRLVTLEQEEELSDEANSVKCSR